jgi:FkbM family methyltransferase
MIEKSGGGQTINGISICSPVEFVGNTELNNNTIVIIDNMRLSNVFFNELFELGFPQERIYRTKDDIIRTAFGNIYYDLEEMTISDNEVFIDAGSFNGETTIEFINTVHGKYKKIYACEPMTDMYDLSYKKLADYNDVEIHKVALGNECRETTFAQSFSGLMGSRIGENGDYVEIVQIDTIDHILKGERASFIKMDIEGAELDALKGAEFTLRTYKPNLAISLYHNNEDLYEIPLWIKSVVPDYEFYLRHYSNKRWDLVLYCIAK